MSDASGTKQSTLRTALAGLWSQPLAVVMSKFDFMKQFSKFATLAAASGGSVPVSLDGAASLF